MDQLWAPWRARYVTAPRAGGCVFCEAPAAPAQDSLVVATSDYCYVVLNRYPYNPGHVMVVPLRHEASLAALTAEELFDVVRMTARCEEVLVRAYAPGGINVGLNLGAPAGAGIHEHLHVHLVPRWNGDTNFISVLGETRVLSEDLPATVARLRPLFDEPARPS